MPSRYLIQLLVLYLCLLVSSKVYAQSCYIATKLVEEWITTIQEIQLNQRELLPASGETLSRFYETSSIKSVSRFYSTGNPRLIKVIKFNTDINFWKANDWKIVKCQECKSSDGSIFFAVNIEVSYITLRANARNTANLVIDVSGGTPAITAIGEQGGMPSPNKRCDNIVVHRDDPIAQSRTPTAPTPTNVERKSEDQEQIEQLKKQLKNKDGELAEARRENVRLTTVVTRNTRTIDSLTQANLQLTDTLVELRSIRDCIVKLDWERRRRRNEARRELDRANNLYESFKRDYLNAFKGNISEEELTQKIVGAWEIYEEYLNSSCCIDAKCGSYAVTFCDDHRTAQDHLNVALILTYFPKYIESSFREASNTCQTISRMNEIVLVELSQAIKKTNELGTTDYTLRSDMERVIHLLPYSLSPERRCDDNATFRNTNAWSMITKIKPAYDEGDYITSIYLYNRYQRFFEFEGIKEQKKVLDEAKFAAAAILLWDLGNVSRTKSLFTQGAQMSVTASVAQDIAKSKTSSYPGNWLADFFDVRQEIAARMLTTLAEDKDADTELRKEAYILLSKRHKTKVHK
jgi:hypothetical protein